MFSDKTYKIKKPFKNKSNHNKDNRISKKLFIHNSSNYKNNNKKVEIQTSLSNISNNNRLSNKRWMINSNLLKIFNNNSNNNKMFNCNNRIYKLEFLHKDKQINNIQTNNSQTKWEMNNLNSILKFKSFQTNN